MLKSKFRLLSVLLSLIFIAGCDKEPEAPVTTAQPQTTAEPQTTEAQQAAVEPQTNSQFATDKEKFSYTVGVQIGQNMVGQAMDIDHVALGQGVSDTITNAELKLTMAEMEQVFANYQAQEQQRQTEIGAQNLAAGETFLAENKKNADVTETASGLQYKVLTKGTGVQPKPTDSVVVHYRGSLVDGTEFDSSYGRGEPITISLDQVIPAWQEVVPMMPVGSKWQVFIPSKLGYGESGSGPIGPNSTLIFDVELLSIAEAPVPEMTPVP